MRSIGLAFAVLLFSGGLATTQAGTTAGPLDGKWVIAHRAYTPSSNNDPYASVVMNLGYSVQFANGTVTAGDPDKGGYTLTVTFSSSDPRAVDFQVGGFVLHGIYQLQDGVLSVAVSFAGSRPTTFDDTVSQLLVVLTPVSQ